MDILEMVDPNSIPKNNEFIRYMETGMSNREFKSIFGTLQAGWIHGHRCSGSFESHGTESERTCTSSI